MIAAGLGIETLSAPHATESLVTISPILLWLVCRWKRNEKLFERTRTALFAVHRLCVTFYHPLIFKANNHQRASPASSLTVLLSFNATTQRHRFTYRSNFNSLLGFDNSITPICIIFQRTPISSISCLLITARITTPPPIRPTTVPTDHHPYQLWAFETNNKQ